MPRPNAQGKHPASNLGAPRHARVMKLKRWSRWSAPASTVTIVRPMRKYLALTVPAILLAACGQAAEEGDTAEDFAARVNGTAPQASGAIPAGDLPGKPVPPKPSPTWADAALTPDMANCGADKVAPFLGQPDNSQTRKAIVEALGGSANLRFVKPGNTVEPDPRSKRLNVMVDVTGTIRTARCG